MPEIFRIPTDAAGTLAFVLVDREAVGYSDTWQAPAGARFPDIALTDYDTDSASWSDQIFSAGLTASPNVNTTERKGTFRSAPAQSITVGEDTFQIEGGYFQDPHIAQGLSAFLYENRTKLAYVYLTADGDNPPRLAGRVRLASGNIGGDAFTDLEGTLTLPLERAPDVEFGTTSGGTRIVRGDGLPSVATAGTPGTYSPTGTSSLPSTLAQLQASGIVADPTTAWTTGQSVELSDGSDVHWTGTAWAAGLA